MIPMTVLTKLVIDILNYCHFKFKVFKKRLKPNIVANRK